MREGSQLPENWAKFCVTTTQLPALAHFMHDYLKNEVYDPNFLGQDLETVNFDTPDFKLCKAREPSSRYATVRLRCYPNGMHMFEVKDDGSAGVNENWAFSTAECEALKSCKIGARPAASPASRTTGIRARECRPGAAACSACRGYRGSGCDSQWMTTPDALSTNTLSMKPA
jgi:hypothetical protein